MAIRRYTQRRRLGFGRLLAGLVLLCCVSGFAQQAASGAPSTGASAQGTLAVSVTVVTSVGVVIGPDREPRIVVANAVDPKDNVSNLEPVLARTNAGLATSGSKQAKGDFLLDFMANK